MITVPEAQKLEGFLCSQVPCLGPFRTATELRDQDSAFRLPPIKPEDTAFLQFTSGSTGNPKGVVLSHKNLLANIRAVVNATQASHEDVFVSWLPLYHDMGLIGALLSTLYSAVPLVLMSPLRFLARPVRWLEAIHQHHGTMTAAPNFAYELCVRKVPEEALKNLDLSHWRVALNGAEAIAPGTMERFQERFGPVGFHPEVMQPVYGLAECSVGLTGPVLGRPPRVDHISKDAFETERLATPVESSDAEALEFVACGVPLVGHDLRVVDDLDQEIPERHIGRIQFRGPSATAGYFENPEATQELLTEDKWLNSGDLGYLAGGEVFLTGRAKDLIIRGGRNLYPQELEELVGELPGVRKGNVAVFASRDLHSGTEHLVVLAETREKSAEAKSKLEGEIRRISTEVFGFPAEEILLAAPGTVLKTSSGKIRRGACRESYERGGSQQGPSAPWKQFLRIWMEGLFFRLTSLSKLLRTYLVSLYFWFIGCSGFLVVRTMVLLMPTPEGKAWAANFVAWWTLRIAGVTIKVTGKEWIQKSGPVVYISNHTSYLDSLVLLASLPPGTCFTPKRELLESPIVGGLSRDLRFVMVERFHRAKAGAGEVAFRNRLEAGDILHVFPEGTCVRAPGLLPFHLGAFLAASETGTTIRPLVLRGVRNVLRPSSLLAWPGPVEVEFGPPVAPEGSGWKAALDLRNKCRAWILERCGEPDLNWEDTSRFFGDRKMPVI
jgi:1-acyl-sn-glycerol-3-phosphate acyltransferase